MSQTTAQTPVTGVAYGTIIVEDQQEALDFYTEKLGFEVREDEPFKTPEGEMRWVTVGVPGQPEYSFTFIPVDQPTEGEYGERIEAGLGTNLDYVLATDDCEAAVETYRERGVTITSEPQEMPWGISAMIEDLYGNPYNLIESIEA